MSLFGMGKKKDDKTPSEAVPSPVMGMPSANMPEFPSLEDEEVAEFPKYEPTLADIKKEIGKDGDEDFGVPTRNRSMDRKISDLPSRFDDLGDINIPDTKIEEPLHKRSISSVSEGKPLFVKIDNYKDAIHIIDSLKVKLEDAEEVLKAFEDIKLQEDEKLQSWKKDLQNMKDKLASIDKDLFEV